MTTVYSVSHTDGIFYVPTKAEAVQLARRLRADGEGDFVNVMQLVVAPGVPLRELYCALLNSEGWAASSTEVDF